MQNDWWMVGGAVADGEPRLDTIEQDIQDLQTANVTDDSAEAALDARLDALEATFLPVLTRRVQFTAAEIRALNTTPKVIVPAGGAGSVIFPERVMLRRLGGTHGYTVAGVTNVVLCWEGTVATLTIGAVGSASFSTWFSGLTGGEFMAFGPWQFHSWSTLAHSGIVNKGLCVGCTGANPADAAGDVTWEALVDYRVWPASI